LISWFIALIESPFNDGIDNFFCTNVSVSDGDTEWVERVAIHCFPL
jgi:hypothetical protein